MIETARKTPRAAGGARSRPAIFDADHLRRYTMGNDELEHELIDLFLGQLASLEAQIEAAASEAEWRMAGHTLKGSARAIGAPAIANIAVALEEMGYLPHSADRSRAARALGRAVQAFRRAIKRAQPLPYRP